MSTGLPNQLSYDLFCGGQTLMANGRVIVSGSYFVDGVPNERVSVFNPADNTWNTNIGYWMNRDRYYPSTIRMPFGELVNAGGQDFESGPNMWIDDAAFELNTNIDTALAPWVVGTSADYDFLNYPQIYPLSYRSILCGFRSTQRDLSASADTHIRNVLVSTNHQIRR
ncbi:MAG: hypothetical protein ABIV13_05180 [Fimbriimonadales bacterium]